MKIGLIPMMKYDERLTRISQEEYLQIIRDNANTMAVIVGTNPTVGLDSAAWVNQLFAQADRYKESLEPWTIENGMLTPTLKLKRRIIKARYQDAIASLYADARNH